MPINTQPEVMGTVTGLVTGDYVYLGLSHGGNMQTMSMQAQGTWDGAHLVFQISNDNTNWYNATSGGSTLELTADGWLLLQTQDTAISFINARLAVTSGGGSEDLTVTVAGGRG